MGALILCYHHINYGERINPEIFEENLITLKKYKFSPVKLIDIREYIVNAKKLPKRSVHITFDDGYADNFIYAYPLLKKYGFFATEFIIANRVVSGKKRANFDELKSMNLTHTIDQMLKDSEYLSWEEVGEMSRSGIFEIGSHSLNHNACFSSAVIRKFNNGNPGEWFYSYAQDRRLGIPVYEKKWECAADCLRDDLKLRDYLADCAKDNGGVFFFMHSNYKRILFKKYREYVRKHKLNMHFEERGKRISKIKREVADSKQFIEDKINRSVNFFCYPWGDYDELSKNEIQKAGYLGSLTLNVGLNNKKVDPYLMKRVEVRGKKNWLKNRIKIYGSEMFSSVYSKIYHKI